MRTRLDCFSRRNGELSEGFTPGLVSVLPTGGWAAAGCSVCARLRRVDCFSNKGAVCGTTEVVPFQSVEFLRHPGAPVGLSIIVVS